MRNATTKNSVPTIQCRVQKQAPEARNIKVAAMTALLTVCAQPTPVQYWADKGEFDSFLDESVKL